MKRVGLVRTLVLALVIQPAGLPAGPLLQQEQEPEKSAQEEPQIHPAIPEEERARKNPIPPTEEALDVGRKLFSSQCVMCHGQKGDGKGDLAVEDKLPVPDFTRPELQAERTDGELFYILKTGHGHMPAQGKRLREEQRWNLIHHIRTFAKPGKSAKDKKD